MGRYVDLMQKIVDCFPYFDKINAPILELRLNLLKDYVDYFIVSEANRTHSGQPIEYGLEKTLDNIGFSREKIIYVKVDLSDPVLENIDHYNCYGVKEATIDSAVARSRERIQRDSVLQVMDRFDDEDVFIMSDADEIINPNVLSWIPNIVRQNTEALIKIPLIQLEGRADLRVYIDEQPMLWDRSMFMCTTKHLSQLTPTELRSGMFYPPPEVQYCLQDDKRVEDIGWHFTWMGSNQDRLTKSESFIHYADKFDFLGEYESFSSDKYKNLIAESPSEGRIGPSAIQNSTLRKFDTSKLPQIIFDLPRVQQFLLP